MLLFRPFVDRKCIACDRLKEDKKSYSSKSKAHSRISVTTTHNSWGRSPSPRASAAARRGAKAAPTRRATWAPRLSGGKGATKTPVRSTAHQMCARRTTIRPRVLSSVLGKSRCRIRAARRRRRRRHGSPLPRRSDGTAPKPPNF
jgi:hypothetical protein